MDKVEIQRKWEKLIEQEEEQFSLLCEMDNADHQKSQEKSKELRKWWQLANAILWMLVRTKSQANLELTPFPAYTLGRIANIAEEISNGIVPSFVAQAASGGRPRYRAERHHIAYGVAYIEAAKSGLIDDRSPNKTVRQAYNVTKKSVQKWCGEAEEICVGVPYKNLSPAQLKKKMFDAGAVYSRIGRGAPSDN